MSNDKLQNFVTPNEKKLMKYEIVYHFTYISSHLNQKFYVRFPLFRLRTTLTSPVNILNMTKHKVYK